MSEDGIRTTKTGSDRIKELASGQPVITAGAALEKARGGMVMLHGRGGTARDILALSEYLDRPGFAYLAPQAAGNTWYPYSFLAPIDRNEPALSRALDNIADLLAQLAAAGFPAERTLLLGFSQGACLALEFAARHPRRYGGVVGLSGGLIGPHAPAQDYAGSLEGTPIFVGCSDVDPHIPQQRVHETADVMRELGAEVTERIYQGMGHTINQDEIDFVRDLMAQLIQDEAG
jgi:phospholipase/carboxylesterase/glyoxalase family protein